MSDREKLALYLMLALILGANIGLALVAKEHFAGLREVCLIQYQGSE